jgi:hypothetical protein
MTTFNVIERPTGLKDKVAIITGKLHGIFPTELNC